MVDMISLHQEALESENSVYHIFLLEYKNAERSVYGFVEGKDDPSFYKGKIDSSLPDGWKAILIGAGNKRKVYDIYKCFDWNRFHKERVAFFVDRDLDDFLSNDFPADNNIYVTDCYSIENSVINAHTLRRVLQEVYGIPSIPSCVLDTLEAQFEEAKRNFVEWTIPIMAQILLWRRKKVPADANSFKFSQFLQWNIGILKQRNDLSTSQNRLNAIWEDAGLTPDNAIEITSAAHEVRQNSSPECICRGKYLIWLFVTFCQHVKDVFCDIFPEEHTRLKERIPIGQNNAMVVIGPRAECPKSLSVFIERNYCTFARRFDSEKACSSVAAT